MILPIFEQITRVKRVIGASYWVILGFPAKFKAIPKTFDVVRVHHVHFQ